MKTSRVCVFFFFTFETSSPNDVYSNVIFIKHNKLVYLKIYDFFCGLVRNRIKNMTRMHMTSCDNKTRRRRGTVRLTITAKDKDPVTRFTCFI